MGGGSNTTNTGLGDDQFQTLADNQYGISEEIVDARADAGQRYDQFDDRFDGIDSSISGVSGNISDISNSMLDQFNTSQNNQQQLAQNQMTGFTDLNKLNQDRFNNLTSDVSDVQGSVGEGFASAGRRFDNVDQANQNIQQDVTTGFSDQARAFNNAEAAMAQNTQDIRGDLISNFSDTNNALTQATDNIQGDIQTTQANVLQGQGGLATDLSDLSDTNDIYFGTLSDNQQNLQTGQDNFRSSFDDYVERYSDDTTLANQTRADLQSAQATGFDTTREGIGTLGDTLATGQQSLAQTFMDESGQIDTALIMQARDLAGIASTQTDLDMGLRQNFQQISTAFDDQGQLIQNSVDANGNSIKREMDDNGMLMLRAMDAQGNDLGSKVIDVNDSVRRLQGLTRRQGANAQMGQLSPALQEPEASSGFATPFTTTR